VNFFVNLVISAEKPVATLDAMEIWMLARETSLTA